MAMMLRRFGTTDNQYLKSRNDSQNVSSLEVQALVALDSEEFLLDTSSSKQIIRGWIMNLLGDITILNQYMHCFRTHC